MKVRGLWYDSFSAALLVIVLFGIAGYSALSGSGRLAVIIAAAAGLFMLVFLIRHIFYRRRYMRMLRKAASMLDSADRGVLEALPYPVGIFKRDGSFVWGNNQFIYEIFPQGAGDGYNIRSLISNFDESCDIYNIRAGERYFTAYSTAFHRDGEDYFVIRFSDNTELKKIEKEYLETRPYVIFIEIDNIDDSRTGFRDSEKAEIKSRVEAMLDEWCDSFSVSIRRIGDDRYMCTAEKRIIEKMMEDKFSIIEKVRNYQYKEKNTGVTLSFGVATGENIYEAEKSARKAFDMALGRGGDQVALCKADGSFEFIGGVSRKAEKYSKTRSRMLARNLASEIEKSSNVIVMGHKNSDFDAIGAACGIAFLARTLGVPAAVAVDRNTTMSQPLINQLEQAGEEALFIDEASARKLLNKKTYVILVDTHIAQLAEFPALFESSERSVIVDHHRRDASTARDDRLIYHDPSASSTSEIVTDYISYTVDDSSVPQHIAEALLAGIVLDTENFTVRTGAGTFEAAAYLRARGADLLKVKELFTDSIEVRKLISDAVNSAQRYSSCLISRVGEQAENPRLIASKAANELLDCTKADATFVLFRDGDGTGISARSLGKVNVQLIMEALGGGGHSTMAASRLDTDIDAAEAMLKEQIDRREQK